MNPGRGTTAPLKTGYRVTVKKGREQHNEMEEIVMPPGKASPEKTASVGLSASIGMAKEYGSEKFEVAVWCTLPCLPDEESVAVTYQECYDHVERELRERSNQVVLKFFPEMKK